MVAWELLGGTMGWQRGMRGLLGVMNGFISMIVVIISIMLMYVKSYQKVHFKCVWFIVCRLCQQSCF